jgi:uncharacterized protein
MRTTHDVFHLAIPTHDLGAAQDFYVSGLGCELARRYDDRITVNFFGDQLVCHLSDDWERDPKMYPRHFGVTFHDLADYDAVLEVARSRELPMFAEPFVRFEARAEEHRSFMLRDPSNNLLEFKHYNDPRMMY